MDELDIQFTTGTSCWLLVDDSSNLLMETNRPAKRLMSYYWLDSGEIIVIIIIITCWLLVVGCWLSAVSCWLLAVDG